MKKLFSYIVFSWLALSAWGQADTIFVIGAEFGSVTVVDDSTFQVSSDHPADQLGQGFLPTQIKVGYQLFDVQGRLFRVSSIVSANFGQSTLQVVELQDNNIGPIGVGVVYRKHSNSNCVPRIPEGNTGLSPAIVAKIHNHNIVNGCGSGGGGSSLVDSTRLAQDSILVYYQDGSEVGRDTLLSVENHLAVTEPLGANSAYIETNTPGAGKVLIVGGPGVIITRTPSSPSAGQEGQIGVDALDTSPTNEIQDADEVSILDAGGNFVSTDVEGALNENATNIFALDAIVAGKLDTVVVASLNDSTFVAHNYAGGSIVRSDTIIMSGTGGGGGGTYTAGFGLDLVGSEFSVDTIKIATLDDISSINIADNQIAYGNAGQGLQGTADYRIDSLGLLLFSDYRIGVGYGANSTVQGGTSANSTGSNWVAQGFEAGAANTTGSNWIAQGYRAGFSNTTGSNWIAQGFEAGAANTTGSDWIAQGYQAGAANIADSDWMAQGYLAGSSNTTGSNWVAQGARAGFSNTTGSSWLAQGVRAGFSNTTGSNWIAQGYLAGRFNTTGSNWMAQGFEAGFSNTTGFNWLAQGVRAGRSNTTGSNWVAQGFEAGRSNTTGSNWIAQGYLAGRSNTTGSNWIAQGFEAGRFLVDGTTEAEFSNSVYVGASTKVGQQNAVNETVIGYAAEGEGSNTVVIGNSSVVETYLKGAIVLTPISSSIGALGVQYVHSTSGYLDHNGTEFLRRVLMENAAPADGDLLEWNATNTRWEAVAPTMLTDMNYTLNNSRTATLDAVTNYETFTATAAAGADYVLTLPAPGPSHEGKQVIIYSADTSVTYDLTVTAGTSEIRDQTATVTSLSLGNGETNILACMQTGVATYKWVLIGNR